VVLVSVTLGSIQKLNERKKENMKNEEKKEEQIRHFYL
jgi:hypothetical protein